jgi:hypothetical protein
MRHPDYAHVILSTRGNNRPRAVSVQQARATLAHDEDRYDAHLSIARYTDDLVEHAKNGNGRLARYAGPCYADYLWFDIDRGEHGNRVALGDARKLALTLHEHYGVREDQVRYFYSGSKGYHEAVPMQLAGDVAPSPLVPQVLRRMAAAIAETAGVEIDQNIYRQLGTIRANATQHPKTQRWKTEFTWSEFSTWTPEKIVEAASGAEPRPFTWRAHDLEPSDALSELWARCVLDAEAHEARPRPEPKRARGEPLDVDAVVAVIRPFYLPGHRHPVATCLAGYLAKQGVREEEAVGVVKAIAAGDEDGGEKSVGRVTGTYEAYAAGVDVRGWTGLAEELTEDALAELARVVEPTGNGDAGAVDEEAPPRQTIEIRQALNAVTNEAMTSIASRPDLGVYVRGRMLVTVGRDGSSRDRWLRRPPGSPVIVPVAKARMLAILDDAAEWVKFNARAKEWVPGRPPEWVAEQLLARLEWPFPYLDAVVEQPTLRSDGSVLDAPGWDEVTGLLYEPMPGASWPAVPARPSKAEVTAAVKALEDPVRDFPFVADSDRAAYAAAVLSLLARHTIDGPVPMFAVRAPTPATGKSLLAEVIGLIGTGRTPPAMTMTYEGEELRKRITALAVGGTPLVLIDNLSGSVGSDTLAAALTATEWEDRVLGFTQMVRVPLRTVWLATGNNIAFRRTLGRRVVPIDLDAGVEVPEDRTEFTYPDLTTHVRQRRPRLVAAGLTILRAFYVEGKPTHGQPRMGSFEAWDDLIRSAVIWAGMDDPASTEEGKARGRVRAQGDDDLEGLGNLLHALATAFPNDVPFSTAQVIQRARDDAEFQAVLDAVAAPARGGHATSNSVGGKFRDHQGRPVGGLVLRKLTRTWKVETMEATL